MGLRRHLRSNVVAYVALMVAVIGAPAAWAIGKNTVGTAQLKNGAVKRAKIANGAINSAKVADGSLRAADFGAGQLPAGPQGEPGPAGATGPAGTPLRAVALIENDEPAIDGTIPPRGITGVSRPATGIYCITASSALDPETDPPIITFEYNTSSGENYTAMWDQGTGECPDGTYEVNTYQAETGAETNEASFVFMVP